MANQVQGKDHSPELQALLVQINAQRSHEAATAMAIEFYARFQQECDKAEYWRAKAESNSQSRRSKDLLIRFLFFQIIGLVVALFAVADSLQLPA